MVPDILSGNLDHTFTYIVPEHLKEEVYPGAVVIVPFGKGDRQIKAYVLALTDQADCASFRLKSIIGISPQDVGVESRLIALAGFMKEQYGATLLQCLKTVLPVSKKVKQIEKKEIMRAVGEAEYEAFLAECVRKHQNARVRLLSAVPAKGSVPWEYVSRKLNVTGQVLKPLVDKGILSVSTYNVFRNPFKEGQKRLAPVTLNESQKNALAALEEERHGQKRPCLIYGITGSGKTQVYIELISQVVAEGKQAIVLIPEISLTYQTMLRFHERFGDRVSFIHSRLSQGERYDQFQMAREGKLDIMIGPRSAVFTPFENLGLIIIDEEHEGAYKSEQTPRYHAKDVAVARTKMCQGLCVLGSATPSVESVWQTAKGNYRMIMMKERAVSSAVLPKVHVVDMRKELAAGNKTMFSRMLYAKIGERLEKNEQVMLFLNRRGYSNFVSCRACGEAVRCPHCDVTLTYHKNGSLRCHYCGYVIPMVKACPSCGSPYVAGFGTGTQQVEEKLSELFPKARILRMDMDTTSGKNGHEEILAAFSAREADILVGTQMIVKGHDFANVTLVGALAADTSLYASDFRACERTFQLLTQAAGRAGRADLPGEMVIQTYKPDQYSIETARAQDYEAFYAEEIRYRRMMHYPPAICMTDIIISSPSEKNAMELSKMIADGLKNHIAHGAGQVLGPSAASIGRINDIFYFHVFVRTLTRESMNQELSFVNELTEWTKQKKDVMIQFDIL